MSEDALAAKQRELDELQSSYDEFIASSREVSWLSLVSIPRRYTDA